MDGFKPFVRTMGRNQYICLRRGRRKQIGFGRYSEERWNKVKKWYEEITNKGLSCSEDRQKAMEEAKWEEAEWMEPRIKTVENGYATIEELRSRYGIDKATIEALLRRNLISDIRREERDGRRIYLFNPREIRDAFEKPLTKAVLDADREFLEGFRKAITKELQSAVQEIVERAIEEKVRGCGAHQCR
jgi:predicted transcriptional regulator